MIKERVKMVNVKTCGFLWKGCAPVGYAGDRLPVGIGTDFSHATAVPPV